MITSSGQKRMRPLFKSLLLTLATWSLAAASLFPLPALHSSARALGRTRSLAERRAGRPRAEPAGAFEPQADVDMVREVSRRLLAVVRPAEYKKYSEYVWPPTFTPTPAREVNAYADVARELRDKKWEPIIDKKTGKFLPIIEITEPLMKQVIQGNEDRLAFILGHELAHILLGHVLPTSVSRTAQTGTLRVIFTAEQEHEADELGMKLALAAGYSAKGARDTWNRIMSAEFKRNNPGWDSTSFEGMRSDHPAWTERLSYVDRERAKLWRSMSSFENGVFFLLVQQYDAAEESFNRVVNDETGFPDSYEAWANLGYARLMQYLDALDDKDLGFFNVGHVVVGSFYLRPEELIIRTKGINTELWEKAVDAFNRALQLKSDLTLAKASLGVAYLFSPTGKNAAEATRYLEQAAAAVNADKNLNSFNRASVMINTAVALLAAGKREQALQQLDRAESLIGRNEILRAAAHYNRALVLAASTNAAERAGAVEELEGFLKLETPASLWWERGYSLYAESARKNGLTPKPKDELFSGAQPLLKPVTSVDLSQTLLVTISDPMETVKQKLGDVPPEPVIPGTKLVRLSYPARGLDIIGIRRVTAIFLNSEISPTIKIQPMGMGTKPSFIKVGMTEKDAEKILGRAYNVATFANPEVTYRFYPEVGVALRYNQNRIQEMALAQLVIKRGM